MKAWQIQKHGGPELMQWNEIPLPEPGTGEVRIRHTAVALNFRDILVRRGQHSVKSFPSGLGTESAGVIDAVGPGVAEFKPGDRVATVARPDCAYAEARIAPAVRTVNLPDGLDEKTAASMMVRGMTARYLLKATYAVKPGDTIVIHAAAGGVGQIVSQWAKHLGATVIGTVGSDDKAGVAKAHGCDHVFRYDDFAPKVIEVTGGKGVPVVYDSIGKLTFESSLKCLRARHPRLVRRVVGRSAAGVGTRPRQHGFAVRHPSEPHSLHADARRTAGDRERPVRHGGGRQGEDRDQPQLSAQRGAAGASRRRGAQDHGIGGADPVSQVT